MWTGWPLLRGNLLHDFQALNGLEMSLFDYLDDLHQKPQAQLTAADYAILDQVAETILEPENNFEDIRKLFEEMPRTKIIRSHLRMIGVLGDQPVRVTDRILDSDMQRLKLLGRKEKVVEGSHDSTPVQEQPVPDSRSSLVPREKQNGQAGIFVQGARKNNLKDIDVPETKLSFGDLTIQFLVDENLENYRIYCYILCIIRGHQFFLYYHSIKIFHFY